MPYTLITATYGGEVNHSRGYETLRMCQEARSIALTGMTIEQNEEADRFYAEVQKAMAAERKMRLDKLWLEKHPPRTPNAKEAADIREMIFAWTHDPYKNKCEWLTVSVAEQAGVSLSSSRLGADGLIYDQYVVVGAGGCGGMSPSYREGDGESMHYIRGNWVKKHKHDVKSAHCVLEMPDAPQREATPAVAAA